MDADVGWDDFELLAELVRTGTLSGAADALRVDQTTASRRLVRLERRLGAPLFDRIDRRLVGTPLLTAVLPEVAAMADAAEAARERLARTRQEACGTVRVSSLGLVHQTILAPRLAGLFARNPEIAVDLSIEDRSVSFERREADLAVRLGRGPDHDGTAVIRKLGTIGFSLYRPKSGCRDGLVVAYSEERADLPEMAALAALRPEARVAVRSNRLDVLREAALSIGAELMLPDVVALADPRLELSPGGATAALREVYRLAHPARIGEPAVRAVARWIDGAVAEALSLTRRRGSDEPGRDPRRP